MGELDMLTVILQAKVEKQGVAWIEDFQTKGRFGEVAERPHHMTLADQRSGDSCVVPLIVANTSTKRDATASKATPEKLPLLYEMVIRTSSSLVRTSAGRPSRPRRFSRASARFAQSALCKMSLGAACH
ncbi:hypothetical protein PC116_g9802 [Phytophthora cactorum]|uniref:Uncharacterized protein n=1 Tax=Phytophthora cactorum TaxID=29920 RepID=A0A8T1L4Z7_9STRA|nr:hypothetical protein PC111_g11689 [Phytophthora cactorum]KAG2833300.1 hypothetical protein PC112_g6537 [Phytophthora cactorum]KAG2943948.1 hypothetical protein PC117_g9277 [Phytophthora cactorum]KAG3011276.1 hypothetical protein PC119_g13264 [Phytophthora cactorum]KAG3013536.1 hypothetical protein PC120_g13237 [Phytophthora cactorum]